MSHDANDSSMSRRDCMLWLGRAAAAGCALELCSHDVHAGDDDDEKAEKKKKKDKEREKQSNSERRGEAAAVNLMALPNGKALEADKSEYILTRTEHGVAALSVFCTHRRNRLQLENGVISCPVHGSEFDLDGKPLNGPATRALTWFAVQVAEDGTIRVDTSKQIPEGNWAPLPTWARKP